MPIGNVGFANIEEQETGLFGLELLQASIDPIQLTVQIPGITGELKLVERLRQHGAGVCCCVEPGHSTAADRAIPLSPEPLDHIGAVQIKAVRVLVELAPTRFQQKHFGHFGVQERYRAAHHP